MVLLFFGPDPKKKKKENWVTKAAKLSVKRLALQYLKIPLILENILLALKFNKKVAKNTMFLQKQVEIFSNECWVFSFIQGSLDWS